MLLTGEHELLLHLWPRTINLSFFGMNSCPVPMMQGVNLPHQLTHHKQGSSLHSQHVLSIQHTFSEVVPFSRIGRLGEKKGMLIEFHLTASCHDKPWTYVLFTFPRYSVVVHAMVSLLCRGKNYDSERLRHLSTVRVCKWRVRCVSLVVLHQNQHYVQVPLNDSILSLYFSTYT